MASQIKTTMLSSQGYEARSFIWRGETLQPDHQWCRWLDNVPWDLFTVDRRRTCTLSLPINQTTDSDRLTLVSRLLPSRHPCFESHNKKPTYNTLMMNSTTPLVKTSAYIRRIEWLDVLRVRVRVDSYMVNERSILGQRTYSGSG